MTTFANTIEEAKRHLNAGMEVTLHLPQGSCAVDAYEFKCYLHKNLFGYHESTYAGKLVMKIRPRNTPALYVEATQSGFAVHTSSVVGNGNKCVNLVGSLSAFIDVCQTAGIRVGEGGAIPF